MKTTPEQPQFFATLAREFPKLPPHHIADHGLALIRLARKQSRLAVSLCNGWIDQDAYDKKGQTIQKHLGVIARELHGLGYIMGGDPRGAALKLVLPSGNASNDWGREGYCVPEGK